MHTQHVGGGEDCCVRPDETRGGLSAHVGSVESTWTLDCEWSEDSGCMQCGHIRHREPYLHSISQHVGEVFIWRLVHLTYQHQDY